MHILLAIAILVVRYGNQKVYESNKELISTAIFSSCFCIGNVNIAGTVILSQTKLLPMESRQQ